jgi:hypothetical protein
MDLDTLHNWLMFRPLLVFILACPFLVLPLVISWWKDRRVAKRAEQTKPDDEPPVTGVSHAGNSPIGGIRRAVPSMETLAAPQLRDIAKRASGSAVSTRMAAGGNRLSILRNAHGR